MDVASVIEIESSKAVKNEIIEITASVIEIASSKGVSVEEEKIEITDFDKDITENEQHYTWVDQNSVFSLCENVPNENDNADYLQKVI